MINFENFIIINLQVCNVADSGNKLLSGKHQEDNGSTNNEDRSINISPQLSNDGWQKQRKKSVQKPENKVQLNLSNRFSFWEESESEDKDKCDVKSDELACFTKIVRKQRRAPDCQNKKQRCMIKKDVKDGELFNRVSAFQSLTEEDVDDIINRHNPIKIEGGRIKCTRCNFKTRCSSNLAKCKANGKKCSNCFKSNHFAKSKNCQKTRKEKFKANMNEQNQKESCQTLRYFLKSHNFHLKHGKIPYDDLKLKSPCHHVNKDTGDENSVGCDSRQIMICIKILEEKIELKNKVSNLCYGSTAFLLFYLLVNMDSFLLQKAFDLQQDHSNQDVLIMQNLVTLNKDKKQIPTEMNNEEILMQKLQTQIYKSEKLVKKYTHKLVGLKRNGKGVEMGIECSAMFQTICLKPKFCTRTKPNNCLKQNRMIMKKIIGLIRTYVYIKDVSNVKFDSVI